MTDTGTPSETPTEPTRWCTPGVAHAMTHAAPDVLLGYSDTGHQVYQTGDKRCYHCGGIRPGETVVKLDGGSTAGFNGWVWRKPLPGTCRHQSNLEMVGGEVRCLDCNTIVPQGVQP